MTCRFPLCVALRSSASLRFTCFSVLVTAESQRPPRHAEKCWRKLSTIERNKTEIKKEKTDLILWFLDSHSLGEDNLAAQELKGYRSRSIASALVLVSSS